MHAHTLRKDLNSSIKTDAAIHCMLKGQTENKTQNWVFGGISYFMCVCFLVFLVYFALFWLFLL